MAIMHDGRVQQVGTPDALYERPANLFVADFLGKMNFFQGGLVDGGVSRHRQGRPHPGRRRHARRAPRGRAAGARAG